MKLFSFLRSKPQVVLQHPVFGKISLEQGKSGPYWAHEAYDDNELAISIETRGDLPPTDRQVEFFQRIVRNTDKIFAMTADLIAPRYEGFFRAQIPSDWREALRLCSVGVPLEGAETNDWDVTFESLTNNSGFLFTCYFEKGAPSHVSVDT